MEKTVFASLDKRDLEELIRAYNDKLVESTDRYRHEETAKEAYHDDIRPLVKKLAKFVEQWEELDTKEKQGWDNEPARFVRSGA